MNPAGELLIADNFNNRIRKIDLAGNISTVAGSGATGSGMGGFSGDGGPATAAELNNPFNILVDRCYNIYIGDGGNQVVRMISHSGIITTICGTGTAGYSGDGGPATAAEIDNTSGFVFDKHDNLYLADGTNARVRRISNVSTGHCGALDEPGIAGVTPESVQLYPNPAQSKITIQSSAQPIQSLALTNILGKLIETRVCNSQDTQLDIRSLPAGIYLVRINGTIVRKFVKE